MEQLEATRCELDNRGLGVDSGVVTTLLCKLTAVEGQLEAATVELGEGRELRSQLHEERNAACGEVEHSLFNCGPG